MSRKDITSHAYGMIQEVQEIPVEEEFCVLVHSSKKHNTSNCEIGRNPNFFELNELASLIHSSFVRLPENMDPKTWITFFRRMVHAKNEYEFQSSEKKKKIFTIFLLYMLLLLIVPFMCLILFVPDFMEKKAILLLWLICVLIPTFFMEFILGKMGKIKTDLTNEYKINQEEIVKEMQLAFKCSGYSAELLFAKCCRVTSRYVRFTPISESEKERIKVLVKDFQDVYNAQKDEAKNKPYDPSSWKPLEGQWEEVKPSCVRKRWLFNGIESKDAFCCLHESDVYAIPCVYHLQGNLLLPDSNPSLHSEIFRLDGNFKKNVAFYRFGCYQIWKVEGSTCMQYKFEGSVLSVNCMINRTFWSSLDPIHVYQKTIKENYDDEIDIEMKPLVHAEVV